MSNTIKINKGSDFQAVFNWIDEGGNNVNLTGYTIAVYDANEYLQQNLNVAITDPLTGQITLSLQWGDDMPLNNSSRFRLRLTQGEYDVSTNLLIFEVL